ncbi:ankyrin repeat domain-containing protein [Wolbachia endosymbiont (group A) of Merzomyia westermanni]|uniref:ankyrin repeat domain-containing protein n=1 Tax=Wolbachia endosymbiont (group A) of Merzomyia westermanni TaxID=2954031 RepID=UPI002231E313|nr:ankyrin repeat domain-containing protein [Wolbachia endosymbiont (group A) of Merzomyia westermanni]
MVDDNQQQEKPQDFELIELLFGKVGSSTSDAADLLDKSFEARYQSLVDQIQSYLHSSEKPGFFPHRFLGFFSSVLDTKLNDKLGIKKLHFRFEGARTLKIVAETESKIHVFIFTEDIEAQHSKPSDVHTRRFEFTKDEFKSVIGKDYTELDARKLQIDVIKILKDKYELVKSKPKSDKDVKSKKLYLYLKRDDVLEYKTKNVYGNVKTIEISRDQLKGKVFDEVEQFLGKQGKDLSDNARKELSRMTSEKGYTLKSNGENKKINIKVESKKKIKDVPILPSIEFQEVVKKLGKSIYLESYIEKLANPDAEIDQVQENLKAILNYIKKVHTNLNLQNNVYGIKAREAGQHGFVAGMFDNFRYRDNTKLYLEQFAGGGYADIVLLVRGPNRAVDSVPILIELKAGTVGEVTPNDALKQAEGYIEGFRPNKMRVLTNADNAIAVGLNLDYTESFKTEVKPIKQPPVPLMEDFVKLAHRWNNQQISEEDFKREIADLLSSEYHTFPANKETKDHYYFSRDILGQSILINKIGQDQSNIKKYIYSYDEYPLNWPQGTEYTLSKSPIMTLILVQGNEGQEKIAFIFHIRESNTKEFYADKKIPVLNIPEIGRIGNVIEIKMSLKKYEAGLFFEDDLFKIEQISKYKPSGADQKFTGSFLKIPDSNELKVKLDQAITSQHVSDSKVSLQAYKVLLSEVADAVYPIKDLITNEARLQAVLNGLFSSYSDLKLQETSAKTIIIPEFQVGAGGRVDMVIQGIGPSPQGTKEYTSIALEFKLIDKNLDKGGMKKEVDKLTKEQNVRYSKGAALKAITDSDKMFFMGVVVNVKAQNKDSLILTSDELISAKVSHSSIDVVKEKHLKDIKQLIQRLKSTTIKETLESATIEKDYHYWLQQHDIADIARVQYGYRNDGTDMLFEIVGSPEHIASQLQQFQNSVRGGEKRPLTLIVNLNNNHWVTLVISYQNGQYSGYYVDSLGNNIPGNIRQVLQRAQIAVNDVSVAQQIDGHNCGLWALENARDINTVLQGSRNNVLDEIRNHLQVRERNEDHFVRSREYISNILSMDPQRIANLEAILSETQQSRKKLNQNTRKNSNPNSCAKQGGRSKRSTNPCLFSKDDVEKFSKGKVDENNVDKIIIDSEKFLTYLKNSQDETKNAQLIEFVGDKNIEGDRKYLLDKVVGDQGYERYVQNERVKNLHGDISQQASSATKGSKLKGRLMNAAGGIQLIRGIHGAIVSCKDGTATDCGLNLGGIGWSFTSQPIESAMVKITPKVIASAERVMGKIVPGTLGKQTKFAVQIAGVKFGSTIAKGTAGAIAGVFDIVEIGMSASNLVDCKKRENSNDPCGEKEIRDNTASVSFSSASFVSGVALTAAGMPVIGIAVGFGLMVGYGIYSGVSNIVEYEKKYDTTHGENWSIFWRTLLFQPMAADVQHLVARKETVNSLAKEVWQALNNGPNSVVAYGVGLGKINGDTIRPDYAIIMMNRTNANTENLSRVIPDHIKGANRICLPQITEQDYEKGIKSSILSAKYYCDNAMVISHDNRVKQKQKDKTIVYDLQNVSEGTIIGHNKWNNNFLIYPGTEEIVGGNNVANRFVLVNNSSFLGKIIGGSNSANILDLSQLVEDKVTGVIDYRFKPSAYGRLNVKINNRLLIDDYVSNNLFSYHYIARQSKVDEILCMGYSEHFIGNDDRKVIVDSGGGFDNNKKDVVENCKKVIISPYTTVKGGKSNYTFYVKTADYKGKGLYSEIDVDGIGTIIFPEIDLLGDCDQITYSTSSNTLSLKINFGQNNQFTLDIKNYVEQSSNKPHFALIDKNGSNIVPKIERSDSSTIEITSFELHSEHPLDSLNAVENHYKKILNNGKNYKVFSVIRGKTQGQDNNIVPHMAFGSSGDDVINFDQGTIFARGGRGSDVYVIANGIGNKEIQIDNYSDDEKADTLFMPEVKKDFLVQQCNLHLNYNNTSIQVKNYLQDHNHRHLIIMNKKGETFTPNIQLMSCSPSYSGEGKLVPFLQATQTQSMFLLSKDFQGDHVVIDSRLEDIEKYKDQDDLLLIRERGTPFIVRIEGFYTDQSKWKNISYSLWENNDLFPSPELLGNVDNVMEYKDKLRGDYKRIVKEYVEDFSNPTTVIQHNQKLEKNISTAVGQDEERIGVMILKNISPGQVEVFSSDADLIFRDKRSNHTVNIKGWNNSKSYRISTLEFDLGLEPVTIRRLDRFSLSEVGKIQDLIGKASENYQNRDKYTPKTENDFKCLISIDSFESENRNPTYQCLGFSSLQDQISFTEDSCSLEQLSEFGNKLNVTQISALSRTLQNNLLLSGYGQDIINQCSKLMMTEVGNQQSKIFSMVKDVEESTFLGQSENKLDLGRCLSERKKRSSDLCTVFLENMRNELNREESSIRVITSGYETLDIENLPIREVVMNDYVNGKKSLRSTLYLRELVEQIDEDLGIKPVSMVIKDESDLLIKLYISATGLQQDIITVRLKDALVNKWYKKLQIIFNNALMEIGDGLDLEPSLFVSDKKITLVRPQDVEERNKIIVSKRAGHYTYLHDKYDLIVTNAFDAKIEANELCVIRFKDFYKEPKMKTLSIRFADKEILLNNEIDKIYNSESAEKLNYVSSVLNLQKSPLPLEANVNITDVEILKQKLDLYRQLLTAVQNRDLNKIKDLISKGADIDVKDNSGRTPEDEERYTNSDTMRQVFMQAHLDKELLLTVKNEKDLKTISDLIAKDIDDRTHGGFYYTWSGNLDTVEFLVSTDVSVNATDKYGCTLLHWAALKGHSDIAKFLVDKEANVNAKDILGRTPIHFAVMNNHKDIQDVYGRGSTYTTAESSDEEVIQLFLMRGASINEADKNGETPLHLASWGGHLDTLQHLINNGANISTKDSSGKTPLDIARDKGHNNLVQCLQQTQLILDKQLLSAIGNSDLNKVRGLVAQGANIDTNNKNGNTLLYSAAEIGDLNLVKLLLDNGANIEAKNGEYQATPLHGAVENYRIDVVKLLLNRGANVNAEDKDNWTPLHYAADTNSLDIAKVLVDAHANLGAKGNYGKTPLDIAKDKGHNNIVEYLEKKFREERGEPLQRKRRHHHGDHARHHMSRKPLAIDSSNQPEIATSSAIKPSSWINDLFDWVKGSVGGLLNSKPTLSRETSSTSSPILQVDAKMDVNGTIMLLDVLIRKVTGQKYISTVDQSISPLEAQGYTLNITKGFEKVVEQAGLKSGVSMHRLNIDFVEIQKEVTGKIMSGKFNEISGVLRSYVEKACPGREAGCPGKLSPKKFDKFMTIFDNKLDIALNQSIQQILHGGDGKLEVRGAEKQQMSLEPQSYLSNASIQNHSKVSTCLSDVGVTKLGNTLSK